MTYIISLEDLVAIVESMHERSFIQLPSNGEKLGNCTIFANQLARNIIMTGRTNGANLVAKPVTEGLYWPGIDQPERLIITPPDRETNKLGVIPAELGSIEECAGYLIDHNISLAIVTIPSHAFVLVQTSAGLKVADAQRGFVCDVKDWKKTLEEKSGIPAEKRNTHIMDILDVSNATKLSNEFEVFEKTIRAILEGSALLSFYNRDIRREKDISELKARTIVMSLLANPKVIQGLRRTDNCALLARNATQYLLGEGRSLDIPRGHWCLGLDRHNKASIFLGLENGVLNTQQHITTIKEKCTGPLFLTLASPALGSEIRRTCERVDIPPPGLKI